MPDEADGWLWLAFGFPSFLALTDGLREAVRAETGAVVIRGYDEADAMLSFGCWALRRMRGDARLPGGSRRAGRPKTPGFRGDRTGGGGTVSSALHVRGPLVGAPQRRRRHLPARSWDPIARSARGWWWTQWRLRGCGPRCRSCTRASGLPWRRTAEAVGCHLSHLYPSGSSLYFTFLVRGNRRPRCGIAISCGVGAGSAKLRGHGRDTHASSWRGEAEVPASWPGSLARPGWTS